MIGLVFPMSTPIALKNCLWRKSEVPALPVEAHVKASGSFLASTAASLRFFQGDLGPHIITLGEAARPETKVRSITLKGKSFIPTSKKLQLAWQSASMV